MGSGVSLMSAGLDSIAVTELTQTLSTVFGLELSPMMLFDHPTLDSVTSFLFEVQGDSNVGQLSTALAFN